MERIWRQLKRACEVDLSLSTVAQETLENSFSSSAMGIIILLRINVRIRKNDHV